MASDSGPSAAAEAVEPEGGAVVPAPAAGGEAEAPPAPENDTGNWMTFFRNVMLQLIVFQVLRSFVFGQGGGARGGANITKIHVQNIYAPLEPLSMRLFASEFNDTARLRAEDGAHLLWSVDGLAYADWAAGDAGDGTFSLNTTISVSKAVQNNGSLFAHAFFFPQGHPEPIAENLGPRVLHSAQLLTQFLRKPKEKTARNLMESWGEGDDGSAEPPLSEEEAVVAVVEDTEGERPILSYWSEAVLLNLVDIPAVAQVSPQYTNRVRWHNRSAHYPVLFWNRFWTFKSDLQPINETTPELRLNLSYAPLSVFKWQLMEQMTEQWQMKEQMGLGSEDESETMRRMLVETNPYLLALTFGVSILHTVFDVLAFKNDIQFWRKRKSMSGLSVRSLSLSIVCQVVILLYLLDKETSSMILFSSVIGMAIQIWKLKKAVQVSVDWEHRWVGVIPSVAFLNRDQEYVSTTKQYDDVAFKYLTWVLSPMVAAYAAYSFLYSEHEGLYSFTLGVLATAVYAFGFALMVPQLYINYKLKSVAHLPWRMLTYKFLNTIIDDLFAFVVKMPALHRASCFRDDIIFLVYLYQRWAYRTDLSRSNEYGLVPKKDGGGEGEGEGEGEPAMLEASGDEDLGAQADSGAAQPSTEAAPGLRQRRAPESSQL